MASKYYVSKGSLGWASLGVTDKNISIMQLRTKGGYYLNVFYNKKNDLFVVDKIKKGFKGGNEIIRMKLGSVV